MSAVRRDAVMAEDVEALLPTDDLKSSSSTADDEEDCGPSADLRAFSRMAHAFSRTRSGGGLPSRRSVSMRARMEAESVMASRRQVAADSMKCVHTGFAYMTG